MNQLPKISLLQMNTKMSQTNFQMTQTSDLKNELPVIAPPRLPATIDIDYHLSVVYYNKISVDYLPGNGRCYKRHAKCHEITGKSQKQKLESCRLVAARPQVETAYIVLILLL